VILERHAANTSENHGASPKTRMELSRIFAGARSKKRRRIQSGSERATAISVVPSQEGLAVLVGTDRSRLWIVPVSGSNAKEPYFLSLHDEKKSSLEDSRSNSRGFQTAASTEAVWRVTDVVATNSGTWWTVAAAAAATAPKTKNNRKHTGLLMSWHASTGMVVAKQETRAAIQAIVQDRRHLYSAANERAITVWDSSFGLNKSGRFWSSPPLGKALAVVSENYNGTTIESTKSVMAVAGVGDRIDLFVDHCRVQTMRI